MEADPDDDVVFGSAQDPDAEEHLPWRLVSRECEVR